MAAIEQKTARPSYVSFERRPVEDREASLKNGHYTTKDVDFAIVTPHGTKDRIERVASEWFKYLEEQCSQDRIPQEWVDRYNLTYQKWKAGEEAPLDGTPIKGWPLLSPAQQSNLIALNIKTVEDLAELSEEAKARFGMGAVEIQRKAKNWLDSANSIGKTVARLTAIETEFAAMKTRNEQQAQLITQLRSEIATLQVKQPVAA